LSSLLDNPKKLYSKWVMMPREMTPMYVQDGGFQPLKVEGLLPYFLMLHRMMRKATSGDQSECARSQGAASHSQKVAAHGAQLP
jgi:hypothetical protein